TAAEFGGTCGDLGDRQRRGTPSDSDNDLVLETGLSLLSLRARSLGVFGSRCTLAEASVGERDDEDRAMRTRCECARDCAQQSARQPIAAAFADDGQARIAAGLGQDFSCVPLDGLGRGIDAGLTRLVGV